MIIYLILHSLFITLYRSSVLIASVWNQKARLWIEGRKDIFEKLKNEIGTEPSRMIWMHCSSLGEYEQGRPLLEMLKKNHPEYKFLLTFFSPSGYFTVKGRSIADYVYFLPLGNRTITARFIDLVKPALVLWIKYDYWYYYLHELQKRNLPVLLISGNFMKEQPFFKWYGKLHREMLHYFDHLFVQTPYSKELLDQIGFSEITTISGDTRFDRVTEIARQFESIEVMRKFCGTGKVIVAGSTWPEDEDVLHRFANIHPNIKFIIAPHEVNKQHLNDIEKKFRDSFRYSVLAKKISEYPAYLDETSANVLIIDNIGMLSRLYNYATITYIGGGFGDDGVHNVLEAAVYGKPVVFGPVFNKYIEAIELLEEGAAYTIANTHELEKVFNTLLSEEVVYKEVCDAAKKYVWSKRGATKKIMQYIQEKRLLTN